MANFSFPSSPTTNEQYTFGNKTWMYNGTGWVLVTGVDAAQSAWSTANLAYIYANTADVLAQSAFDNSNTKFSSSGGTISGSVVISGNNNLTVTGNLIVQGYTTTSYTNSLTLSNAMFSLHTANSLAPLTTNDGLNIGMAFHYYDTADKQAILVRENSTGYLTWYNTSTNLIGNTDSKGITMGTFQTDALIANSATINGIELGAYSSSAYATANTNADVNVYQNTNITIAASYANSAYTQANTGNVTAQEAFNKSNTNATDITIAASYANSAYISANLAQSYSNSAYTSANTNATNATIASSYANSAYTAANLAQSYANSAFTKSNTNATDITITASYANSAYTAANGSVGVNTTQNTNITIAASYANSAYTQANTGNVTAQAAFDTANSAVGVNTTQNTNITIAASYANSAYTAANLAQSYANSAYTTANGISAYANNTFYSKSGGLISGDVSITGNLVINGTTTTVNTTTVSTVDSLIKLASNNISSDSLDIGFYGVANTGTTVTYHGLVRQAGTNNFLLFRGLTQDPSGNTLPAGSATAANTATLYANLNAYSATVNGFDIYAHANGAFTKSNTNATDITITASYANSAYTKSNTNATDITIAASYANSAYTKANTANVTAQAAFDRANTNGNMIAAMDTFTSSGGTTITLSATPATENSTMIYINGVYQHKDQYSLSANIITFITAPQSGDFIEVTTFTSNTSGLYYTAQPISSLTVNNTTRLTQSSTTGAITMDLAAISGLTAGTYSHPLLQVDSYGRITTISSQTAGTTITDDTTTATTHYPVLAIATSGSLTVANTSSTKLTYVPSTGTLSSTVVTASSDERLKSNIETIVTPIGIIKLMRGVSFIRNDSGKKDYGVIAQEIEKVLPEIVHTDDSGMKSVSYNSIIGFLIEAVKDLQDQIDELKQKIN